MLSDTDLSNITEQQVAQFKDKYKTMLFKNIII